MKRTTLIGILTLAIFAAGCGGSSPMTGGTSGGGGGGDNTTPFDGDWGGTWSSPNTGKTGKVSMNINNGHIDGSATYGSNVGTVTGDVTKTGELSGIVRYPNNPDIEISGHATTDGSSIEADLTQSVNGNQSPFSIKLKKL